MMGPCGCGKTTVGSALADRLGGAFIEGDEYHPEANRAKMSAGEPLSDADRWPWLDLIGDEVGLERVHNFVQQDAGHQLLESKVALHTCRSPHAGDSDVLSRCACGDFAPF